MNILTIATAIGIIVLGYFVLPMLRRAAVLRKHGVPRLPKRTGPVRLPPASGADAFDPLDMARQRRHEALGVSDEFDRDNRW